MPTAYRKQAMKLSAPSDKDIILKPIQPNLGVEAAYRKSLKKLLREMRADVQGLLERHYPKGIAQDSLTDGLQAALSALLRYWLARLDKLAPQIAEVFANQSTSHTEIAFQTALRVVCSPSILPNIQSFIPYGMLWGGQGYFFLLLQLGNGLKE